MGFFSSLKNIFNQKEHPAEISAGQTGPERTSQAQSSSAQMTAEQTELTQGYGSQNTSSQSQTGQSSTGQAAAEQSAFSESYNQLLSALREAQPKLSAWLDILLTEVPGAGTLLTQRLLLLFKALETPEAEAEKFIRSFNKWLDNMGYSALSEFRSELQYRLALALDLEDEEDERSRLLLKLGEGLAKTRAQFGRGLNALFQPGRVLDESFWEELEEVLLLGDVGYEASMELTRRLRRRAEKAGVTDPAALRDLMRAELGEVFQIQKRISAINPPEILLMVGVNGAGKTTTIAKLAHRAIAQGRKTLIAAGDTFRAAAVEQLEVWAKRTGADFYAKGHGADPAAVAYEATEKALRENYSLLLIDTAGRLQTKTNLMEELEKIRRVVAKLHPGAPQRCILVLDANTGQNALSQAEIFKGASGVNEIILTKLDGTAKGGVAVAIALQYGLPISFIGLGEKMEDMRPFDGQAFAAALMAED